MTSCKSIRTGPAISARAGLSTACIEATGSTAAISTLPGACANGAVAGVCALVLMVSSAIGVSTATASATVDAGPFALNQPYAPATALGQ